MAYHCLQGGSTLLKPFSARYTCRIHENLNQSWDILVEEKIKWHFCFRRVCLPHCFWTPYMSCWWHFKRWRLYNCSLMPCQALPTHCSCGQLHFVAMYCASTPDLPTLCQHEEPIRYQQNQSGTCQLQDSSFTITTHFLWALPSVRWLLVINPWLPCIICI